MNTVSKDRLLLQFRAGNTMTGVTRDTLKQIADRLGFNETQVVHFALARLAKDILPAYEPDDGPLTKKQLNTLRKTVPQDSVHSVKSSLF